ncbi:unnamed protein product [Ixodes pacificus]
MGYHNGYAGFMFGALQSVGWSMPAPRGSRPGQSSEMLDRGAGPGVAPIARHVRWGGVRRWLLLLAVIRWPVVVLLQGVGAQFGQQIVVEGGARLGLADFYLCTSKGSPK